MRNAPRTMFTRTLIVLLVIATPGPAKAQEDFPRSSLESFLGTQCGACHAAGAAEGGLDLESLSSNLSDMATFTRWERIYDRVESGEMPPKDVEKVEQEDLDSFLELLRKPLFQAHSAAKGTILRRLNRREYQNTLNDIFGTHEDLESRFPEDGRSHEFDNVGAALGMSMVHLQQYLNSADAVMDAAISNLDREPVAKSVTASYADTREGAEFIGKIWKQLPDGSVVFFEKSGYPTGMLRGTEVKPSGRYKIRVTGYAYQSDQPITFRIGGTSFLRGSDKPTYGFFELRPGDPQTIELEAFISPRYMIEITPWGLDTGSYNIRNQGVDDYQGAGLAIQRVELIGPLFDEYPSRGHRLLFDGFERKAQAKKNSRRETVYELSSPNPDQAVEAALKRISEKAFRRPTNTHDLKPYLAMFEQQLADGATLEEALRSAVAAIFCSAEFLYLDEPEGRLSDAALATRLSYFLTRSAPDEELLEAVATQSLTADANTLLRHTRRLLDDPKHERFLIDFCDAWLNLRDIEFTSPDQTLFPEYDEFLQDSMIQETRSFVRQLIAENLPIDTLVRSDFAMLNNRLAQHYGIANVDGPQIRPVSLPDGSIRGGLLSQASVLKVSANGTNTSPVVRGVWVMERIAGQPPQPPPPGVPGVEPDVRGATTLRALLDKHRNMDSCRSCHAMIDPPGFALECFNPIGGYRERFRSLGEGEKVNLAVAGRKVRYRLGPVVDSSGQLSDGREFANFNEFRNMLAADRDTLAKAFTTKLLTFATGREMGFSDRPIIAQITEKAKANGYGIRDILELVVDSEAFRTK